MVDKRGKEKEKNVTYQQNLKNGYKRVKTSRVTVDSQSKIKPIRRRERSGSMRVEGTTLNEHRQPHTLSEVTMATLACHFSTD